MILIKNINIIDKILKKWPVPDAIILQVQMWMADYVTKNTGSDAVTLANYHCLSVIRKVRLITV